MTYSASACWSADYSVGLLSAPRGSDPMDAATWTKSPRPVLAKSPANNIYATGLNGFFTFPDERDNWIIYHADTGPDQKCTANRSPRIQPFGWTVDGRPDFPVPVGEATRLAAPSGDGSAPSKRFLLT